MSDEKEVGVVTHFFDHISVAVIKIENGELKVGDSIFEDGKSVATVEATCFSHVLNAYIGLALFPVDIAFAGLRFNLRNSDGPIVETISMPPIMPKSLSVKLDEM